MSDKGIACACTYGLQEAVYIWPARGGCTELAAGSGLDGARRYAATVGAVDAAPLCVWEVGIC